MSSACFFGSCPSGPPTASSARPRFNVCSFGFFLVSFAVSVYSGCLSIARVRLFLELTEAKWSPKPLGRKVVTHNRLFIPCVHRPHSLDKLGFGFRHACKLPQMLRPRAYEHFCSESAGMFEVLVEAEKKSAVPQKDQSKLFDQRKEFFPVIRTND